MDRVENEVFENLAEEVRKLRAKVQELEAKGYRIFCFQLIGKRPVFLSITHKYLWRGRGCCRRRCVLKGGTYGLIGGMFNCAHGETTGSTGSEKSALCWNVRLRVGVSDV
jgi:hypothetical protein